MQTRENHGKGIQQKNRKLAGTDAKTSLHKLKMFQHEQKMCTYLKALQIRFIKVERIKESERTGGKTEITGVTGEL